MSRTNETMNCDEYKLALTADPGFEDESGHAESCASCRAYAEEIAALNSRIAAALELAVPPLTMPSLPDVDAGKVVSLPARGRAPRPLWFALAATVLLAAFIGIRMTDTVVHPSLAEQVLAHVDHEPDSLRPTDTPVSAAALQRAVPPRIAALDHSAGLITYAQSCSINGREVPHLVIQGEHGPVTILLMPHEKVAEASTLDGENIRGVILPVGEGSIAIVGDREEQLDAIQKNVVDSVMWST